MSTRRGVDVVVGVGVGVGVGSGFWGLNMGLRVWVRVWAVGVEVLDVGFGVWGFGWR